MLASGDRPDVKVKNEFCGDGRHNYVQRIFSFTILNKCYFVVTRSAGLVQLYEKQKSAPRAIAYKLVKEWKNSAVSLMDPVVAVGCFRNQYMYTCSNDGKLVIRDLINDDADDSVKTYLIDGPVSSVRIQALNDNMRVLVAAGGQENELKMYDLDIGLSMASNLNRLYSVGVSRPMSTMIRLANVLPDQQTSLRRSVFQTFSSYSEWRRLVPVFVSAPTDGDTDTEVSGNWILSVCFIFNGSQMLCAGTQFGDLLIFNATEPYEREHPVRRLSLSQFPINTLHLIAQGRYLLYTDTMSKVGIIDVYTFEIVNFYDYLKIGPTVASKVYDCPDPESKLLKTTTLSKFRPIYLVATTINENLVVYKLHDNNKSELKLCISHAGIIPDLDIMEVDAYNVLEEVFGEMHEVQSGVRVKRRKRDTGRSQFLRFGSDHQGRDLRNPTEPSSDPVDDIKSMIIPHDSSC